VLTDMEMNAIGAKIVKAELMGNDALAAKLKAKLERAKAAVENAGPPGREEVVVLTRTDSKGMTRPVTAADDDGPAPKRRNKDKIQTHDKEGKRSRYFADDDRHDLRQMYEREKLSTAEDQNAMMARLAGKAVDKTNEDYDFDDMMVDRAARKKGATEEAEMRRERDRAAKESLQERQTLDESPYCFGGPNFGKHLLIAAGKKCYLALPAHQPLTEGHCYVAPMEHVSSGALADEDVWREAMDFRKALTTMFASGEEEEDCVFFSSCLRVRGGRRQIWRMECVPLPKEAGETAPMYFQKAILECEEEWSDNVKLINLREKGLRKSVPRELPYFHVDFGLQDGFAHVVEDVQTFPSNFAQEIIGGMLDLDPRLWRHPRREAFDDQKSRVLDFAQKWRKFDFTKRADSSSSDSD